MSPKTSQLYAPETVYPDVESIDVVLDKQQPFFFPAAAFASSDLTCLNGRCPRAMSKCWRWRGGSDRRSLKDLDHPERSGSVARRTDTMRSVPQVAPILSG